MCISSFLEMVKLELINKRELVSDTKNTGTLEARKERGDVDKPA